MKWNRRWRQALLGFTLLGVVGCATQGKSVGLGGGIGVGAGAIAGGLANPGKQGQFRTRNVVIGSAIGGAAGMISGALLHHVIEDKQKEARKEGEAAGKVQAPMVGNPPAVKDPQIESRWIGPRVAGNRYIEGHYEYVIINPARWDGL